jgi:hypothetical protein
VPKGKGLAKKKLAKTYRFNQKELKVVPKEKV